MKIDRLFITITLALGLGAGAPLFAKDKSETVGGTDAAFIKKAANGGMTEVELGKVAADKGTSQEVKDFGKRMESDHGKANDKLKTVASKLNLTVPDKVDAKHQATVDKFSKMSSGADFDKAYAKNMVQDHEEDIAEFEKASKQVKDADLKKFIDETVPVMKEHLEMAKKLPGASGRK